MTVNYEMGGGTSKPRQSNFELLRIVAMFLVLIVHADFFSIGMPSRTDITEYPVSSFMRLTVESLALVCVNVYIVISGYFTIKIKQKSVLSFIFMVVFWRAFVSGGFVVSEYLHLTTLNLTFKKCLMLLIPGYDDWFVMCYILLMFFAPILNAFIEKSSLRQLWLFVLAYEGLQVVFAWWLGVVHGFGEGYSVLSFVGLYIMGAAIRRTDMNFIRKPILLYVLVSVCSVLLVIVAAHISDSMFGRQLRKMGAYNGLFVLLATMFLFVAFKRLSFSSKIVNSIAASAFAVYLFHMHPLIRPYYSGICKLIYDSFDTWSYIGVISCFIVAVFFFTIGVDFIRRGLWNLLYPKVEILIKNK